MFLLSEAGRICVQLTSWERRVVLLLVTSVCIGQSPKIIRGNYENSNP